MHSNVAQEADAIGEGERDEGVWHIAKDSCRVFEEQSCDAPLRFVLLKGTYVTVVAREGNWIKIVEPVVGWCCITNSHGQRTLFKGDYLTAAKFRYRVVCRDGALVRRDTELTSNLIRTVPQGGVVTAYRKVVNSQGLVRLWVGDGWISEELNPLSGQRGPIVELIPLPSPIRYRVVYPDGCVVRANVELLSACIRTIPCGQEVVVVEKAWSESPPLQRLKLATGGWISLKLNKLPPDDVDIVVPVGVTPVEPLSVDDMKNGTAIPDIQQPAPDKTSNNLTDDTVCIVCLEAARNATLVHGETGHVACCLTCARVLKARGDPCPVCRVAIDLVIQHFVA